MSTEINLDSSSGHKGKLRPFLERDSLDVPVIQTIILTFFWLIVAFIAGNLAFFVSFGMYQLLNNVLDVDLPIVIPAVLFFTIFTFTIAYAIKIKSWKAVIPHMKEEQIKRAEKRTEMGDKRYYRNFLILLLSIFFISGVFFIAILIIY